MRDREPLEALNRNYVRSVQESDVRWFEAHLAADFMNSNPDGTLVDRAAFLRQIAPPCPVSKLQEHDVEIHRVGDVAIIYARTTYLKPDGKPGAGAIPTCGSSGGGVGCASRPTSAAADA